MARRVPQATTASSTPTGFEWMRWIPLVAGIVVLSVAGLYLAWPDWRRVHAEGGPLEMAQLVCVLAAAALAIGAAVRDRGLGRLNAAWLATVFLLVSAREFDLHERLNEDRFGAWGVSFRLNWWASFDVPLGVKLLWGGIALLVGVALFVPPLFVGAPVRRLLRGGDPGTWLFLGGVALYGAGYFLDDVLGRGVLVDGDQGQIVEELCELGGSMAFLGCAITTWRASGRAQRALDGAWRAED